MSVPTGQIFKITSEQVPYVYKILTTSTVPLTVMLVSSFLTREEGGVCDSCGSTWNVYEWVTAFGDTTDRQDRECERCIMKAASTQDDDVTYLIKVR